MRGDGQKKIWDWPGSWPHPLNDLSDEELLQLSDDDLLQMITDNYEAQWQATGGNILYLSPGDPAMWKDWIRIQAMYVIRRRLGLKPLKVTGYPDMIRRPRCAKGITAEMIGSLGYVRLYKLAYPAFLRFRKEKNAPRLKLRVGIASPFDWAALTNNYMRHIGGFTQATVNEIKGILEFVEESGGDRQDLLFSYETPFGLIITAVARRFGRGEKVAAYFARILNDVLKQLPANIRLGLHPCWGDYNQNSLIEGILVWFAELLGLCTHNWLKPQKKAMQLAHELQSPMAITILLNALQEVAGDQLDAVLLPLAAGTTEPSSNPLWYIALQKLIRLQHVRYIAGMCHGKLNQFQAVRVRTAAELGGNIEFDGFGSTCGLARMTLEQACYVVDIGVRLCEFERLQ